MLNIISLIITTKGQDLRGVTRLIFELGLTVRGRLTFITTGDYAGLRVRRGNE